MVPPRLPGDGPVAPASGAALFTLLWSTLVDVLGPPTASALLVRAARLAQPNHPDLAEVVISPESLAYRLIVPLAWRAPVTPPGLIALVAELRVLLAELTGRVVLRRLDQIPEFSDGRGLRPEEPL